MPVALYPLSSSNSLNRQRQDLLAAALLKQGETLFITYGPRGEERRYEATVLPDGSIEVLGKSFSAPSYAAFLCLRANARKNLESILPALKLRWAEWLQKSA